MEEAENGPEDKLKLAFWYIKKCGSPEDAIELVKLAAEALKKFKKMHKAKLVAPPAKTGDLAFMDKNEQPELMQQRVVHQSKPRADGKLSWASLCGRKTPHLVFGGGDRVTCKRCLKARAAEEAAAKAVAS